MSGPSTKLLIEVTAHDVNVLKKYAAFLNKERADVFFNWRTALSHLLAQAKIEMRSSGSFVLDEPKQDELPIGEG